jgi:hypothetical protein
MAVAAVARQVGGLVGEDRPGPVLFLMPQFHWLRKINSVETSVPAEIRNRSGTVIKEISDDVGRCGKSCIPASQSNMLIPFTAAAWFIFGGTTAAAPSHAAAYDSTIQ